MELSVAELKDRIERCDKLQERINKLEGPRAETAKLRMDNGPELTSVRLAEWSEIHGVDLDFIQPGKPTQNSFVERFNRTYREELLDMYVFSRLSEVRNLTEKWLKEYNEERPHESLGNMTPVEYLESKQPETYILLRH